MPKGGWWENTLNFGVQNGTEHNEDRLGKPKSQPAATTSNQIQDLLNHQIVFHYSYSYMCILVCNCGYI